MNEEIEIIIHDHNEIEMSGGMIEGSTFDKAEIKVAPASDHPAPVRVHRIEASRLNMIYKSPKFMGEVEAVGFLKLDPTVCVYHGQRVKNLHHQTGRQTARIVQPDVRKCWDTAWREIEANFRRGGCYELDHLIGRIDLTLKFLSMGVRRIHWVLPEAGLHPAWQCEIGDLLVNLSDPH